MALTGAFYPAIDVVAGEKERGTMETLLISPASRTEIVLGKFLTVLLFSISTAVLNLLSLGGTGKYMVSLAGTGRGVASRLGDLSLPPVSSIAWVLVMLLPLAALFSALCLALATFARSNKEGQYYLTPVLMVTMGLTVFCLSPGVELEPFYSVMPVMGPSLLLKELLRSSGNIGELSLFAIPVLISSVGYAALALWWAIDQFGREDVLFREAERFDLRLWIVHLFRDKELTPSFAEGMFCFIAIMLLQFAAMKFMQAPLQGVTAASRSTAMMQLLMIQQLVIIATPALMMGVMLTSS
jgi:sodium transport system permease protein